MAKGPNQKLKLLYLARILSEKTDDEHSLSREEIEALLGARDINVERKTFYSDIEELRAFGLDIIAEKVGRDTRYHLGGRDFELPELKLLVDSVQSAKFITESKSRELIKKLSKLVSDHQAKQLQRQVLISGRVKTMNEKVYYNIDALHAAINADRQIQFKYYQWKLDDAMTPRLQARHSGKRYCVSPWALIWDDENYYLVGYDADDEKIKHYRVDKMKEILRVDAQRLGGEHFKQFDVADYTKSLFGMFGGRKAAEVQLEARYSMVGILVDRFGRDIPLARVDDDWFEARVKVVPSDQFLGWIIALGSDIRVTGPGPVVTRMRRHAQRLMEQYGD